MEATYLKKVKEILYIGITAEYKYVWIYNYINTCTYIHTYKNMHTYANSERKKIEQI